MDNARKMRFLWELSGRPKHESWAIEINVSRSEMCRKLNLKSRWTPEQARIIIEKLGMNFAFFLQAKTFEDLENVYKGYIDLTTFTNNLSELFDWIYRSYANRFPKEQREIFKFELENLKRLSKQYKRKDDKNEHKKTKSK